MREKERGGERERERERSVSLPISTTIKRMEHVP